MNTKLTSAILSAGLIAAFNLSGVAHAQRPAATEPSRVVSYSDLDLSTEAGVRTLYGRIQNAAWRVCGDIVEPHNAAAAAENAKCRQALVDAAVAQVNKPALTALHAGKKPAEAMESR